MHAHTHMHTHTRTNTHMHTRSKACYAHLSVCKLCGLAEMELLLSTGIGVILVFLIPADKWQRPLLRQLELGTVKGYASLGRLASRPRKCV